MQLAEELVGIYGFGPIGRYAAELFRVFRAEVYVYDPSQTYLSPIIRSQNFATSLINAQSLAFIVALMMAHPRIGGPQIYSAACRRVAKLSNTARGSIIDEPALIKEVKVGRLLCGSDVIEKESMAQNEMADFRMPF